MAARSIVGNSPIAFTDSTGRQRSVPLSAFAWNRGNVTPQKDPPDWSNAFSSADFAVLASLIAARVAAGEYVIARTPTRVPAIAFRAVADGADGNDIGVALNGPTPPQTNPGVLDVTFLLAVGIDHVSREFPTVQSAARALGYSKATVLAAPNAPNPATTQE
jgi:hypothetical protein